VVSSSLAFPPIIYKRSSSPPFVLHGPPISSSATRNILVLINADIYVGIWCLFNTLLWYQLFSVCINHRQELYWLLSVLVDKVGRQICAMFVLLRYQSLTLPVHVAIRYVRDVTPLWSRGQSSWLQTQRSGFDSRCYQIFWEVMGLERGPLSLVDTTEELLGINSSGSGLENREYSRRGPSRWPRGTLYPQKLALTSPTIDCRSVGIVRSQTQTMEFFFFFCFLEYSTRN
jgi:hypothetical protein